MSPWDQIWIRHKEVLPRDKAVSNATLRAYRGKLHNTEDKAELLVVLMFCLSETAMRHIRCKNLKTIAFSLLQKYWRSTYHTSIECSHGCEIYKYRRNVEWFSSALTFCVLPHARLHAAPQYFLRFTMGVGRNFLRDDFLGLPEHTWEKRFFFNNAVFDLLAFFLKC